ncbi:hypothetical protein ACJX0J_006373 [Zea mays]
MPHTSDCFLDLHNEHHHVEAWVVGVNDIALVDVILVEVQDNNRVVIGRAKNQVSTLTDTQDEITTQCPIILATYSIPLNITTLGADVTWGLGFGKVTIDP